MMLEVKVDDAEKASVQLIAGAQSHELFEFIETYDVVQNKHGMHAIFNVLVAKQNSMLDLFHALSLQFIVESPYTLENYKVPDFWRGRQIMWHHRVGSSI